MFEGIPYLITKLLGRAFKFKDSPKLKWWRLGSGEFKSFLTSVIIIVGIVFLLNLILSIIEWIS